MNNPIVYLVDDDIEVSRAIEWLLKSVKIACVTFHCPIKFLEIHDEIQGCVLLDVRMPILNGMDILKTIKQRHPRLPVIMITGNGDISMAVEAMKAGATDFIAKPFNEQALLSSVQTALRNTPAPVLSEFEFEQEAKLYMTLTERERQVLTLIVEGLLNKQIAAELKIAISTVEMHRSKVMQKMQVNNLAQLIKKSVLLKV